MSGRGEAAGGAAEPGVRPEGTEGVVAGPEPRKGTSPKGRTFSFLLNTGVIVVIIINIVYPETSNLCPCCITAKDYKTVQTRDS